MSRPTIFLTKFIGTISLGLLTGQSLTLALTTLPTLLALPTLPPARSSFATLRSHATTQQLTLSVVVLTSLLLSYSISPRGGRHPYLLWTALAVGVGGGMEWLGKGREAQAVTMVEDEEEEVNGEVVREEMEGWRWGQGLRAGVWALGWGMSVVGIWGDGF